MNADQIAELQGLAWPAEILAKYLHTEPNKIRVDLEAGTWHIKGQSVDYATYRAEWQKNNPGRSELTTDYILHEQLVLRQGIKQTQQKQTLENYLTMIIKRVDDKNKPIKPEPHDFAHAFAEYGVYAKS